MHILARIAHIWFVQNRVHMMRQRLINAAAANERANNGSAIANVKLDAVQCSLPLVDEDEVWRVENPSAPSPHSISDRRGENGMFDRERFECYSTNLRRRTVLDQTPIFDRTML